MPHSIPSFGFIHKCFFKDAPGRLSDCATLPFTAIVALYELGK
jgi:hypothetical protein